MDDSKYKEYAKELINKSLNVSTEELLEKRELYALLNKYLEQNGKTKDEDYTDVVPKDFIISDDIETKKEVLKDAINNNNLIKETETYLDIIEGVKRRV